MMENNVKHFLSEYSKYLDSSGEHLTYAALSAYTNFSDELSRKEESFLKSHLDSCPSCSSRLREVEEVENERVHPMPQAKQWTASPMFRYSIAAALVLALGTVVTMYVLRNRPQEQLTSQSPSPTQPLAVQALDPERFVTNPILDGFIERTLRSASAARFIAPLNDDTLSFPATIRWEGTGRRFQVEVVDNANKTVSKTLTGGRVLRLDKLPTSGLYYVKLEVDGWLQTIHRFYVVTTK